MSRASLNLHGLLIYKVLKPPSASLERVPCTRGETDIHDATSKQPLDSADSAVPPQQAEAGPRQHATGVMQAPVFHSGSSTTIRYVTCCFFSCCSLFSRARCLVSIVFTLACCRHCSGEELGGSGGFEIDVVAPPPHVSYLPGLSSLHLQHRNEMRSLRLGAAADVVFCMAQFAQPSISNN